MVLICVEFEVSKKTENIEFLQTSSRNFSEVFSCVLTDLVNIEDELKKKKELAAKFLDINLKRGARGQD